MFTRSAFVTWVSLSIFCSSSTMAETEHDQVHVGGHAVKQGPYKLAPGESLASVLNRSGGIMATREDFDRYKTGEKLRHVRIDLMGKGQKKCSYRIDPKSPELWKLILSNGDTIMIVRAGLLDGGDYSATLKLEEPKSAEKTKDEMGTN